VLRTTSSRSPSGVRKAPAGETTQKPNVVKMPAWSPGSTETPRLQQQPAHRHEVAAEATGDGAPEERPTPIAIQLMSAVIDTELRLQCIESSSGEEHAEREGEPCPMATNAAAAKT
jgi:hypothetical protein